MEITDESNSKGLKAVELANATGSTRKGTNEATKAIERGQATLVVIAGNVDPPEVVMHLGPLCEEKGIPYIYVNDKEELGRAAGVGVKCAAIAIVKPGEAKSIIDNIKKSKPAPKETVVETPVEQHVEDQAEPEQDAPEESQEEASEEKSTEEKSE